MNRKMSYSTITSNAFPQKCKAIGNETQNNLKITNNNTTLHMRTMNKTLSQRMIKAFSSEGNLLIKTNQPFNNCNDINIQDRMCYSNMNTKKKFKELKLIQTNTTLQSKSNILDPLINHNNANKFIGTLSSYMNKPTLNCVSNESAALSPQNIKRMIYSISKHQLTSKQEGFNLAAKLNKLQNKKFNSIDKVSVKDFKKDKKVFKSMHMENNMKKNVFINLNGKEAISQSNQISNYSPLEIFSMRKALCKRFGLRLLEDEEQEIKIEREERYIKMYQTPEWVKQTRKCQKREIDKILILRNKIKNRFNAFTNKII